MLKKILTPDMFECLKEYEEIRRRNPIKLLHKLSGSIKTRGQDFISEKGFKDVQMWCGAVLGNLEAEGTNINTLSQRANMSKQAISKLVKELNQKKYVTLATDKLDKRAVKVMFTQKGIDLLRHMVLYSVNVAMRLKNILGNEKYEIFIDDLIKIEKVLFEETVK